jgi:flagellar basal body L-ring protein FlgH
VTRHVLLPALALLLLSGCGGTEAIVKKPAAAAPTTTATPSPPPAAAPKSSTTSPTEALRPEVSAEQEQRLLESTKQSIGDVARVLGELEGKQMKPPQQEALRTAKNFLDQARSALDQRDYQRAANLASKARALTDDIAGATK